MDRVIVKLDSSKFTTERALAKEIVNLLETTDYKLLILAPVQAYECIAEELEDRVLLGRVKIIKIS